MQVLHYYVYIVHILTVISQIQPSTVEGLFHLARLEIISHNLKADDRNAQHLMTQTLRNKVLKEKM